MASTNGAQTDQSNAFAALAMSVANATRTGKLNTAELAGSATRAFGSLVFDDLVVDSQFSPEVHLAPWSPSDPDAPSLPVSAFVGYVRPRVRVMKNGETLYTIAPGGEPNGNWLPNGVGVVSGIAAVTAWLLGHKGWAWKLGLVSAGGFAAGFALRPKEAASA